MKSYWTWFGLLAIIWILAVSYEWQAFIHSPSRMLGVALYLSMYFIAPLFRNNPMIYSIALFGAWGGVMLAFWAGREEGWSNPYILLLFSILVAKAAYRLPASWAWVVGSMLSLTLLIPSFAGLSFLPLPLPYLLLYVILLGLVLTIYRHTMQEAQDALTRNEALLVEYRKIRRQAKESEEVARQEERTQIARDIHDSVGHKLTALLMKIEMSRMNTDPQLIDPLNEMKALAKESLEETRHAVKALKQKEEGGVAAVLQLIRNLEAESFLKIDFTLGAGTLSAPLSRQQAVVVYRAIQEALTNVMRHSTSREVQIILEAPGARVFIFEIASPSAITAPIQEGFGLTAMRERMEQIGGSLEVFRLDQRFIVRGKVPLEIKEAEAE